MTCAARACAACTCDDGRAQVVAAVAAHEGAVIIDSSETDPDAAAEALGVEHVRAVFDYDGAAGHLALSVGDRVRVVRKHDSGWWNPRAASGKA